MVVYVTGVDWHSDVVILLLQGSESGHDLGLLVWKQECFGWGKLDLVLVLIRNFPFILQWNS